MCSSKVLPMADIMHHFATCSFCSFFDRRVLDVGIVLAVYGALLGGLFFNFVLKNRLFYRYHRVATCGAQGYLLLRVSGVVDLLGEYSGRCSGISKPDGQRWYCRCADMMKRNLIHLGNWLAVWLLTVPLGAGSGNCSATKPAADGSRLPSTIQASTKRRQLTVLASDGAADNQRQHEPHRCGITHTNAGLSILLLISGCVRQRSFFYGFQNPAQWVCNSDNRSRRNATVRSATWKAA